MRSIGRCGPGAAFLLLMVLGSCAPSGPPEIRIGVPCAGCGMEIQDLRFACERGAGRRWRLYDSIECLARDSTAAGAVLLADYDTRTLAPAESLWVVKGDFPSPMGGGLAAFRDRGSADGIATRTRGRVGRLSAITAVGERP